ncbi:MAG: COG4280 domain-containing protein [Microbacteriaceae bacterium]
MSDIALFLAVFLACIVEAVEATTIVLAAGTARDWRSAFSGLLAGLVVLAGIVAIAGPAITLLPIGVLRLVVGGLLLVFGLQWLRKAILRGSGYKALHDEEAIYQEELAEARAARTTSRGGISDWYAFTLSFKGVLLEGLEVVFIVLTFGAIQHKIGTASLAALAAVILVAAAGFAIRRPLARVPENTMKFVVGVMLTSFGVFWGAEGAGAIWPGADLALLGIIPFITVLSLLLVGVLRRRRADSPAPLEKVAVGVHTDSDNTSSPAASAVSAEHVFAEHARPELGDASMAGEPAATATVTAPSMGDRLVAFGAFWYDFIVGDDWRVTAGIALAFALTAVLAGSGDPSWWLVPVAVLILLPFSLIRLVRSR